MAIIMAETVFNERYEGDGFTMVCSYDEHLHVDGIEMYTEGEWVLIDRNGNLVDADIYRHELAGRRGIALVDLPEPAVKPRKVH